MKFYAHNPNCWLVVADRVAYFQPYTFGKPPGVGKRDACIGPYMPVFKFEQASQSEAFGILKDHFKKLWLTSDTSLFHFEARMRDRDSRMREILTRRRFWWEEVSAALSHDDKGQPERRRWARQPCDSIPPLKIDQIQWTNSKGEVTTVARGMVRDSSLMGISLILDSVTGDAPGPGDRLRLSNPPTGASPMADFLIANFAEADLEVIWTRANKNRLDIDGKIGKSALIVGLKKPSN